MSSGFGGQHAKFSQWEAIWLLFLILEKMGGRGAYLICWKNLSRGPEGGPSAEAAVSARA